jgi:hypothetical protein
MNKYAAIVIAMLFGARLVCAADISLTNGPIQATTGVQVLLSLRDPGHGTESNGPVGLNVTITNASRVGVHLAYPNLKPAVWFEIVSPSGKDLSTREPSDSLQGSHILPALVDSGASLNIKFDLTEICPVKEAGIYRITAKARCLGSGTNFVVISRPINVTVMEVDLKNVPKKPSGF